MNCKRIFIEKKQEFNSEASLMEREIRDYLKIDLKGLRLINIYDIIGAGDEEVQTIVDKILYDRQEDNFFEELSLGEEDSSYRLKYLESQFNQREDSANKLVDLILARPEIYISHSRLFIIEGINEQELEKIKKYFINPVEVKEIQLEELTYRKEVIKTDRVKVLDGFYSMGRQELLELKELCGLGLDLEDLQFCQDYFKSEKRDPSITELKLIDTYWSDHCRHTTFMTEITDIEIEEGHYQNLFQETLEEYLESRNYVYGDREKLISLMDLATINQKELKKKGLLDDKEDTDEVNAASIEIDVDVDGREEKWLLMFKNETHNHPTEIEPFGGAATCLGGAIRDPLSGRSYVYQAMRITGAADPRASFEETLDGKLAQRAIVKTAKDGYSSYGYQIGAATGYVREIYHEGYMAKRMEVGALVAAAPKENVYRGQAEAGDLIILIGGRTGRDGVGGAVGSSKKHTEDSLEESGSEVQKGNPKMERKIVRLFRRKEVAEMIKVCNDFGAGGVSVAIGELADGLRINLDKVPLKYKGLDGTEIALSESQERMAVVIDRENLEEFLKYSAEEDLEASLVAEVTEEKVLRMFWRDQEIVRIDRSFLDTNGIRKKNAVKICQPEDRDIFKDLAETEDFIDNLKDLNICSQKGLIEAFDDSVGRATVLAPLGGRTQLSPAEAMVAKIPLLEGETKTCSLMSYGFDPKISSWSSFHAGYYAVVESVAKLVATGASYEKIRLSFQEYFERIGQDPKKWGQPFAALLGAYKVQKELDIAAIGGKDSMSGSFEDLHVPPTIISFAVATDSVDNIISPEFKKPGSKVGLVELNINSQGLLDLEQLKNSYKKIKEFIDRGDIVSASSIKYGGIARSVAEMCLGNIIGFKFTSLKDLYKPTYGSILVELREGLNSLEGLNFRPIGQTSKEAYISLEDKSYSLEEVYKAYTESLDQVYPIKREKKKQLDFKLRENIYRTDESLEKPRVIIPVVEGVHGEYDMARAFEKAGGQVEIYVIKTGDKKEFEASLDILAGKIENSHILALPDGEILGGEPESGSKLALYILNYPRLKKVINEHINDRKRLVIGIGAGFESLIKTGLIEHSRIMDGDFEPKLDISNNKDQGFIARMMELRLVSKNSAWLKDMELGQSYMAPLATRRGRLVVKDLEGIEDLISSLALDNITGSDYGIDSMSSRCGLVFGSQSSLDRIDEDLFKNVKMGQILDVFKSGVNYFK